MCGLPVIGILWIIIFVIILVAVVPQNFAQSFKQLLFFLSRNRSATEQPMFLDVTIGWDGGNWTRAKRATCERHTPRDSMQTSALGNQATRCMEPRGFAEPPWRA